MPATLLKMNFLIGIFQVFLLQILPGGFQKSYFQEPHLFSENLILQQGFSLFPIRVFIVFRILFHRTRLWDCF